MKTVLTGILLAVVFVLCGEEFALTKNGKAVSSIVLGKNATVVEKHAADELAKFLAKISNGEHAFFLFGGFTEYPCKSVKTHIVA